MAHKIQKYLSVSMVSTLCISVKFLFSSAQKLAPAYGDITEGRMGSRN